MLLTRQRYDEIVNIVTSLLTELNINSIPIDPFEIAALCNIGIVSYSTFSQEKQKLLFARSKEGFCFETDYGFMILYNDKRSISRIRFTIAHELGHIMLEHSQESELAEAEANFFAKHLLAPPVLVQLIANLGVLEVSDFFSIGIEFAKYAVEQAEKRSQYGKIFCKSDELILSMFTTNDAEEGFYGIREKNRPKKIS